MPELRLGKANERSQYYSRFEDAEFDRRHERIREAMSEHDLDALIAYNYGGFHQSFIPYVTNYRPPFPTYLAFFADPEESATIFVGVSNHVQYVREVSEVEDLQLLLPDPPRTVIERIEAAEGIERVGVVGDDPRYNFSLPHQHHERFETDLTAQLVDVTGTFTRLLSVTTPVEQERIRQAAAGLDEAMRALEDTISPGMSERELAGALAEGCSAKGANLDLAFISSGPMVDATPGAALPWKLPSARTLESGDIVTTEISASVDGYATQIHRPYAVDTSPTQTYLELFDVAESAYHDVIDALQPGNSATDVAEAMASIEASPYKIYDVLVHGYGSAYRHPFIGVEESNYWPGADDSLTASWVFEPGMVIVVQPNVVTPDERAGLQFGTTVLIEDDGPDILQTYPAQFYAV